MPSETPTRWHKSSHSGGDGGNCVEVAFLPTDTVATRDSKNPTAGELTFTVQAWEHFLNTHR